VTTDTRAGQDETTTEPKRRFKFRTAFTVLFFVLVLVWILTFIIKPGPIPTSAVTGVAQADPRHLRKLQPEPVVPGAAV